jgi:hypothetical protein
LVLVLAAGKERDDLLRSRRCRQIHVGLVALPTEEPVADGATHEIGRVARLPESTKRRESGRIYVERR